MIADVKALAAESWFGYGRWDAPYWFIGMEPGGDDGHASYEAWQSLGGDELIDCREHHLWKRTTLHLQDPLWTRWHDGDRPPTQPTWRRLIQLLLAYKGEETDMDAVSRYQRQPWGSLRGETAVIEVAAIHSPKMSGVVPFREERVAVIRERMVANRPRFALFYGTSYREIYEEIAGRFDGDGFVWSGDTLCTLVQHPTARPGHSPRWWIDKGEQIRAMIDARSSATS